VQQLNIYKKVKKEKNTMEKETVMSKSPRPSIFDVIEEKARHYFRLGITGRGVYRIVKPDLEKEYPNRPGSYEGFYKWAKQKELV